MPIAMLNIILLITANANNININSNSNSNSNSPLPGSAPLSPDSTEVRDGSRTVCPRFR